MMPLKTDGSKRAGARRRSRLQFGLRFLLIVFTLVIVGVAGWKSLIQPWLERDAIRARLEEMGASYTSRPGPTWVSWLLGEERCRVVTGVEIPAPGFNGAHHDEEFFRSLGKLTGLEFLAVPGRNVTDETLRSWNELTKLKRLSLYNTLVEDPGTWPEWPLQELSVASTRLEDEDFGKLLRYQDLNVLMADNTGFGDGAVKALAALPKLEELVVQPSRVTPTSWKLFASYPALDLKQKFRWLDRCEVLPAIPTLRIRATDGAMDERIGALPSAADVYESYRLSMKNLKNRQESARPYRGFPFVFDFEFTGIDAFYVLELDLHSDAKTVALNSPYVNDERLGCLQCFPNLQALKLDGSWISDAGLQQLVNCPGLRHLSLENTRITNEGLEILFAACPQLEFLSLGGTKVTHLGFTQLAQFKSLQDLILPLGAVRGRELLAFQQLPELNRIWVAPPGKWDKHSRLAIPWSRQDLRAIRSLATTNGKPPAGSNSQPYKSTWSQRLWIDRLGDSRRFYERMTFTPEAFETFSPEEQATILEARKEVTAEGYRRW